MRRAGLISASAVTLALASTVFWLAASPDGNAVPFLEHATTRPLGDYRVFTLPEPRHQSCANSCIQDEQCLAWTYVRPGVEGPSAVCRLKSTVPPAQSSPCCISGVVVGAGAPAQLRR